jgi:uncharacterized damage-inducible protein DinB
VNPNEAKIVADFLITEFEREVPITARVLEAAPVTGCGYRPDAKAKTGLELARHIALEDEWLLNGVVGDGLVSPPDQSDACGIMAPSDAAPAYREAMATALARVRKMSGEQLAQPISFFGMTLPAVNVLSIALKHSVHHRGQLSAYLRAMGGRIPEIYGPSADTQHEISA